MHTQTIQPLPVILLAALTGLFMATWSHDREAAPLKTYAAASDRHPVAPILGVRPQPAAPPVGQPPRPLLLRAAADETAAAMIHALAASTGAEGLPAARLAGPALVRGAALAGGCVSPRPLASRIASTWLLHTPAR